ncbi:hypothetical protein CALVIDRAFT_532611 [Calocera viscosa TUFC12733]|uniref:Uncharacterized protein n=1 Tax=Calocera viscosa (strain TUFC12733) TaxID=1330018 RepID=A0A167SFF6_CALVF|nr:hypothetical protein CALVIDRAFT_532611 [Calocera viscosa TUFC12733]
MLRRTPAEDFTLPVEQDGTGNWVLFDNYADVHQWTLAFGTYRTLEQTRWFVVLMHHDREYDGCRVVGRVFFEDSLPACGVELRHALEKSIMNRGVAMEIKRGVLHDVAGNQSFSFF